MIQKKTKKYHLIEKYIQTGGERLHIDKRKRKCPFLLRAEEGYWLWCDGWRVNGKGVSR